MSLAASLPRVIAASALLALALAAATAALARDPGHVDAARVSAGSPSRPLTPEDQDRAFRPPVRIVNPRDAVEDAHGLAIAVSGDHALVTAPARDLNTGVVHAFERVQGNWQYRQTLRAPRAEPDAFFGGSVAISGDRALVGAPFGSADVAFQGYVVVFARVNGEWVPEAELSIPDGRPGDLYGVSVALSGTVAVIGASRSDSGTVANAGAAYVFVRTGAGWTEQARLFAADAAADDEFGASVAVAGSTAVIGAPFAAVGGRVAQGAAYVFVGNAGSWTQQAKLVAADGASGDLLGTSIAVHADTVLAGAPGDTIGASAQQGSAYVFVRSGASWTQQRKLVDDDGIPVDRSGAAAGSAVALEGDLAVMTAPGPGGILGGGVLVPFRRIGTSWVRETPLANSHPGSERLGHAIGLSGDQLLSTTYAFKGPSPASSAVVQAWRRIGTTWTATEVFRGTEASFDLFGYSVAQLGDTALVGAPGTDVGGVDNAGLVYVYRRVAGAWTLETTLRPSDASEAGYFGFALALDATHAYVSAPFAKAGAIATAGAVHVFERGAGWPQRAKLQPLDVGSDAFGHALALDGATLHVGAPLDVVGGIQRGAVVPYTRGGAGWVEGAKIVATDGAALDGFGYAVAAREGLLLVGAPSLALTTAGPASAQLFERSGGAWVRAQRFEASDGVDANYFGAAVALAPDALFIGAPLHDVATLPARGAVFASMRTGTGWSLPIELPNSASEDTATVGASLAWSNGVLLAGAPGVFAAEGSVGESSVYRYELEGGSYVERARLRPAGEPSGTGYGTATTFDGTVAVIGEPLHDPFAGAVDVGAVHFVDEAGDAVFGDGFEAP